MKRVVHVHCKDVRKAVFEKARAEDMSFMGAVLEGIFTVPGDGSIDYPAILRVLAEPTIRAGLLSRPSRTPGKPTR